MKQAWDVLKAGLAETNPDKRKYAVTALGAIGTGSAEALSLVESALEDKEPFIRQTAVAMLGEMKSRTSIPKIKNAVDDPEASVSYTAAKVLWDMGDKSARDVFRQVIIGDFKSGPGMIKSAVRDAKAKLRNPQALAMMGVKEASGLLGPFSLGVGAAEAAWKDTGAQGRTLSIATLATDCTPDVADLFVWSFAAEKNWVVQAAAAKAIGGCGTLETVAILQGHLDDKNAAVRMMAAASIVRLNLPAAPARK